MSNVYPQLARRYRANTMGRWLILALVVGLFLVYATQKRDKPDYRPPNDRRDFFFPFPPEGADMFSSFHTVDVNVYPGVHEPNNLQPRVQMVPAFDFSGSMAHHISQLPAVWSRMVEALNRQSIQRLRIELACCVFHSHVDYQDYAPLPYYLEKPLEFTGGGTTALGTALLTLTKNTLSRQAFLASEGIQSLRALCPIVTDGCASDFEALESAIPMIRQAENERQIEFIPLAPDSASIATLAAIFGKQPILLETVDFDILFAALTRSLSRYSQSSLGHEPEARELVEVELRREFQKRCQLPPEAPRRLT